MCRKKSYLGSEDSRLNQLERLAVHADQALAGLALSDSLITTQFKSAKKERPPRLVLATKVGDHVAILS